jgi:hypothetical protein
MGVAEPAWAGSDRRTGLRATLAAAGLSVASVSTKKREVELVIDGEGWQRELLLPGPQHESE